MIKRHRLATGITVVVVLIAVVAVALSVPPARSSALGPLPSGPFSATYVALGDSYSSGEGNPGPATTRWVNHAGVPIATSLDHGCHRSLVAYAERVDRWLARQSSLPRMAIDFLACSGSTTGDLWASGHKAKGTEPPQLNATVALGRARIVTVTIGGNDLGFSAMLHYCLGDHVFDRFGQLCTAKSPNSLVAHLPHDIATLEPTLVATYRLIESLAPHAALYVVGYPDLVPPNPTWWQRWGTCPFHFHIGEDAVSYLAHNVALMDVTVHNAAIIAGAHFVELNGPSENSFLEHSVCSTRPWLNGVKVPDVYSFRPNQAGQAAIAQLVKEAIATSSSVSFGTSHSSRRK